MENQNQVINKPFEPATVGDSAAATAPAAGAQMDVERDEEAGEARDMIADLISQVQSHHDGNMEAVRQKVREAWTEIYEEIRKAGFDPSTPEGIAQYRDSLAAQSVDKAIMFDYVISSMLTVSDKVS
ncbi:MAG: hypothetical protein WC455_10650 [Dehalococcoidia bacterium]|jgi:hypothetical protein